MTCLLKSSKIYIRSLSGTHGVLTRTRRATAGSAAADAAAVAGEGGRPRPLPAFREPSLVTRTRKESYVYTVVFFEPPFFLVEPRALCRDVEASLRWQSQ
jgi:hypothetical protein